MNWEEEIKGIHLDGSYFTVSELIDFCEIELKVETDPDWKLDVYRFILDFLNDSDSIIQETSGTTGTPKTVKLPKISMLHSAKNTVDFFRLKEGDAAVLCLPIKYIAGKMMIVRALVAGMKIYLIEPTGTPDFTGMGKTDFCAMVPMQASSLLQKKIWPEIKTLILGGAETGTELFGQLQQLGTEVYETYGMAETCSHVALKRLNGNHPETYFTALPGVQFSTDERDCLVIEASFLPEKIITNDRVEMVATNRFIWLGRFDNVINSGGIKIQPEIMEQKIQEILNVPCAVIGVPDDLLGQKMVLVLENDDNFTFKNIIAHLSPHFDRKMLPKEVRCLEELPRNSSFKIDRKKLMQLI